jgi:hypothetical protein
MTSTKEKIVSFMGVLQDLVYTRAEFAQFGSADQVKRALAQLIADKSLVRVGVGLYTPSFVSRTTGNAIPENNMMKIALVAFKKLGIDAQPGTRYRDLWSGKSTQVPMIPIIDVGKSTTTRRIGYGPTVVKLERSQWNPRA